MAVQPSSHRPFLACVSTSLSVHSNAVRTICTTCSLESAELDDDADAASGRAGGFGATWLDASSGGDGAGAGAAPGSPTARRPRSDASEPTVLPPAAAVAAAGAAAAVVRDPTSPPKPWHSWDWMCFHNVVDATLATREPPWPSKTP